MTEKREMVLAGGNGGVVFARDGGRCQKRVQVVWDGETGLPGAIEASHRATTEDILASLSNNGVPAVGIEDGVFGAGKLTQRFKIMPGSSDGVVRLLPWDADMERRLSIISVRDDSVVVEPKGGMPNDEVLCRAATALLGNRKMGVCQEGEFREGDMLVLRPDPDISGVVRVISRRLGVL